jgi:FkbM family methyltransferase
MIIDAGGNIGITTLFFKRYFPSSRVFVFEAASKNFELLKKNINTNYLHDVTAVFGALGKKTGVHTFYYNEKQPGSSTGVLDVVESKQHSTFMKEEVPAIRLSDYMQGEVDLLKMDVEGAEGEILEELEESENLCHIKQIVMEYHANEKNKNTELVPLLERLERNGFSVVIYDNENGSFGRRLQEAPIYHFMIRAFRK